MYYGKPLTPGTEISPIEVTPLLSIEVGEGDGIVEENKSDDTSTANDQESESNESNESDENENDDDEEDVEEEKDNSATISLKVIMLNSHVKSNSLSLMICSMFVAVIASGLHANVIQDCIFSAGFDPTCTLDFCIPSGLYMTLWGHCTTLNITRDDITLVYHGFLLSDTLPLRVACCTTFIHILVFAAIHFNMFLKQRTHLVLCKQIQTVIIHRDPKNFDDTFFIQFSEETVTNAVMS